MNTLQQMANVSCGDNFDAEISTIKKFVKGYRKQNRIIPTHGVKFELSCESFGESHNLIYRQLATTIEGEGGWKELKDSEVRAMVLKYIKNENLKN